MKRFLIKLFCLLAAVALIVIGINALYIFLNRDDGDRLDRFKNVPESIEICNLGSSHGLRSFNYDDLSEDASCFNFAFSGQTLSYDYRILSYYIDHISKDATVFIPVSYFSLFGIPETEQSNFESKNRRYYHFLPQELIKKYDENTCFFEKYLPALISYENLLNVLLGQSHEVFENEWMGTADSIDLTAYVEHVYTNHIVKDMLDSDGKRIVNSEEIQALYDIISLCKEKGATPVLVTTPYMKEYTDKISAECPEFFGEFYSLIDEITQNTGTPYYDYAFDERFLNDSSLFKDADHLNKAGALKFTSLLADEVIYAGIN